jgi:hypothetical protein
MFNGGRFNAKREILMKTIMVAAGLFSVSVVALAQGYTATGLQLPPGAIPFPATQAYAINEAGVVVGDSAVRVADKVTHKFDGKKWVKTTLPQYLKQAVVWRSGKPEALKPYPDTYNADYPGVYGCRARDINAQGVVVGACDREVLVSGVKVYRSRAVAWAGGSVIDLKVPNTDLGGIAEGVTDANWAWINRPQTRYAYPSYSVWRAGRLEDVATATGQFFEPGSVACSQVDAKGQLFCRGNALGGSGYQAGYLDLAAKTFTPVAVPAQTVLNSVVSSRAGTVAGLLGSTDASAVTVKPSTVFAFDRSTVRTVELPPVNSGFDTVQAVNDQGDVVVRRSNSLLFGPKGVPVVLLLSQGRTINLNDAASASLKAGEYVNGAVALNNKGQLLLQILTSTGDPDFQRYLVLSPQ